MARGRACEVRGAVYVEQCHMRITDAISLEHATLWRVFDELEGVLPKARSVAEVGRMATVVEGLLRSHAELEVNFGFVAPDHALRQKGRLTLLQEHHREGGDWLRQVREAGSCAGARRLLRTGMLAARAHFLNEERNVFPLMEHALGLVASTALGQGFKRKARNPEVNGANQAGRGQ